ncbi:MAG: addiction module protein [Burkholderiaceae bacterium]|nr:addiction module protein [Burkholderiaceae bacterium]
MKAQIVEELIDLSPAEKRELGEALIASADSESSSAIVTDAQRAELRARLAHHRAHPDEPGVTFQELKAKLLASAA